MTSPLRELSAPLRAEIADVRRTLLRREGRGRPTARNAWILTLADGRESPPLHSDRLRDVWWLNPLRARRGRPASMPELTRAHGRRALRLAHEVVEGKIEKEDD